jgi:cytidyltransferase-like protein
VTAKGFGTGFTLGKFMLPHRGHLYLVREAAARCDDLIVLVARVRIQRGANETVVTLERWSSRTAVAIAAAPRQCPRG